MKRFGVILGLFSAFAVIPVVASAAPITFFGAGGGLSAKATFTISGNTLTILLTNTDTAPNGTEWDSAEALTGVFFSLGGAALTPVSAEITAGTIAQSDKCTAGACTAATTNVGGEFGYAYGGSFPTGATHALSSTGAFNPPSQPNFPGGVDLNNHANLNGADFGIMGSTFADGSGNGGLDNDPLIRGSVTLTLSGVSGLTEAGIGNVWFTYGTSTTEPRLSGGDPCEAFGAVCTPIQLTSAPEPGSMVLLGTGLAAGLMAVRRRRAAK